MRIRTNGPGSTLLRRGAVGLYAYDSLSHSAKGDWLKDTEISASLKDRKGSSYSIGITVLPKPGKPDVKVGGKWTWSQPAREAYIQVCEKAAQQVQSKMMDELQRRFPQHYGEGYSGYEEEQMVDIVTPNFRSRRESGEIIINPMSKKTISLSSGSGAAGETSFSIVAYDWSGSRNQSAALVKLTTRTTWAQAGTLTDEDWTSIVQHSTIPFNESVIQNSVNQAFGNMTDADIDLSVIYAERYGTMNLFVTRANDLIKLVSDLKKGNWKSLAPKTWRKYSNKGKISPLKISRGMSEAWLEMRYGWLPLVYDINGLVKTLNKGDPLPRQTFRGFNEDTEKLDRRIITQNGEANLVLEIQQESRAGVICQVQPDLAKLERLGLTSWLNTAWELVPYSFVIDWFIDVGSALRFNTTSFMKPLGSWSVPSTTVAVNGYFVKANQREKVPISGTLKISKRDINSQPTYISFNLQLNVSRLIDAVALLRTWR